MLVAGLGAAGVVGLSLLLRQLSRVGRLRTGAVLAGSHTLVVCGFLCLAPLYIAAEQEAVSPYGDVYVPYLLVPGVHIYHPVSVLFGKAVFPWLLVYMESFPASVICVVVGPGLVGLLVGGVQWYLLGAIWDRVAAKWAGES
jgi:hypothetical protein